MPEYNEDSKPKQSKYNSALAELFRIDSLLQSAHYNKRTGNLKKWNDDLDCVWTELAPDATKEDRQKFREIKKLIIKHKTNRAYLNQILMKKQIFLKKVQNTQGIGRSYIDEDEDNF